MAGFDLFFDSTFSTQSSLLPLLLCCIITLDSSQHQTPATVTGFFHSFSCTVLHHNICACPIHTQSTMMSMSSSATSFGALLLITLFGRTTASNTQYVCNGNEFCTHSSQTVDFAAQLPRAYLSVTHFRPHSLELVPLQV